MQTVGMWEGNTSLQSYSVNVVFEMISLLQSKRGRKVFHVEFLQEKNEISVDRLKV